MSRRDPLVPPDVDVSGLAYMPLYIAKLQKSKAWLVCKREPKLTRPLINLWLYAWQQRPAGSVEDDDDVLADAVGVSFDDFQDLREHLLRGWVKCSDGRLYLPAMVPMVKAAWELVTSRRKKGKAGAAARWGSGNDAPHDASGNASGIPTKDAKEYGSEGGKEGRKEGKNRGALHALKNGHDHRTAYLDLCAWISNPERPVTDPVALRTIDELGGIERLRDKTAKALHDLRPDFESRYRQLAAEAH